MILKSRHLLGLEHIQPEEIQLMLDTAESFREVSEREIPKVPALRGKTIVNYFAEPSTRTRVSFELAEKRLSADTVSISTSGSSAVKGESLRDTALNLQAMHIDMIVVRHKASGAPHFLADHVDVPVVNAGDGCHEHPTQGLLDLLSIRDHFGRLDGLKVAIIGDIAHSRVARSLIWGLTRMGVEVSVCAPATLIPLGIRALPCNVLDRVDDAIRDVDVIYILRLQLERQQAGLIPSAREYRRLFGIDRERLRKAKEDVVIMHPGPINRGLELAPDVADGPHSIILDQVTNGVAVRMAVVYLLSGRDGGSELGS
ncbi:MAG: aspartate carbamoyltransferase catalytic subunit [Candidatus Eisenbacteria sp.]|nr:aspartate carbamoyltransferase catalytic subunit [Candidatus Eisenbacteria bacterium]